MARRVAASAEEAARVLDTVRTLGRLLDDLEMVRVMNGNRVGALEREVGEALPHLLLIQEELARVEHLAELELVRAWRRHPLAAWAAGIPGAGEKLTARLVAVIGDPADRPNVAKLWAYCGFGDPARIPKRKGMTQEELFRRGNPEAKKRAWLLAAQFVRTVEQPERNKAASPYRATYDAARAKYADAVHEAACARCGPAGRPALPGSPLSDGHKHARALRIVAKEFLRDLWVAARAGHSVSEAHEQHARAGQPTPEAHDASARAGGVEPANAVR